MERVTLYLRSSKDRHDVSVESQKRELVEYAKSKGYAVTAVFEDKIESAKSDDRPAFQEMVAEASRPNDRRFDIILCLDTSRFARNAFDAQYYKRLLRKQQGVRVEFAKLATSDSCQDIMVEGMMESIDQFHSDKSRADGLRGMQQNIISGFRAGGRAPIGYKLDTVILGTREGMPITKSKLTRDPEKFGMVQKYLERRASGINRRAAAASTGLKLSSSTLIGIEDNALQYAGHTVWNRHNERIKGGYLAGRRLRPKEDWKILRDTHEPMISDEQAKSIALQRVENGRKQHRGRSSPYLLAGLLKCPCGANFNGDGGYYRCHRSDQCGSRSIKKETVEQAVLGVLFTQYLTKDSLDSIREELVKLESRKGARKQSDREGLNSRLKDITRDTDKLVGLLTEMSHTQPLLKKIEELEVARIAILAKLEVTPPDARELKRWDEPSLRSFVESYQNQISFGDPESKKAVMNTLIASALLDGDNLSLTPNYPGFTGVKLASPRGFEPRFSP